MTEDVADPRAMIAELAALKKRRMRGVEGMASAYSDLLDIADGLASALDRQATDKSDAPSLVSPQRSERPQLLAWRPIETAPKDGTPILATNDGYAYTLQRCGVYYWEPSGDGVEAGWMHQSDDDDDPRATWLTHWMPLPSPPGAEE